jgi:hypothetical protein
MVKHLLATSPHIHTAMPFTLACQAKPSTPSSSANAWHLFPALTPPPQARAEQEDEDEVRLVWFVRQLPEPVFPELNEKARKLV